MRMLGANRAPAKRGKSTIRDKHTHWLHRFVSLIFLLESRDACARALTPKYSGYHHFARNKLCMERAQPSLPGIHVDQRDLHRQILRWSELSLLPYRETRNLSDWKL